MRILLIEDDRAIAAVIKRGLESAHYTVEHADDGEAGLSRALECEPSLIVLDLMLPKLNGWEVCRELRDRGHTTPILMLSARDAVEERIHGLEIGADDYLVKPFHFMELLTRVNALLRRRTTAPAADSFPKTFAEA